MIMFFNNLSRCWTVAMSGHAGHSKHEEAVHLVLSLEDKLIAWSYSYIQHRRKLQRIALTAKLDALPVPRDVAS